MARTHRIFATDKTEHYLRDGTRFSVDFDWQGLGCPQHLCIALGDKVVRVALPEGFPGKALEHGTSNLEVYDKAQSFRLWSEEGQSPRSVRLNLDVAELSVPFVLRCGASALMDGLWFEDEWEYGGPIIDSEGNIITTIFTRRLKGLEKDIRNRKACRPNGRWAGILVQRNEYPPVKVRTSYADAGDVVIVTEHFTQMIQYVWHNYRCENGRWTYKQPVLDTTTRRYARSFEAI